MVLTGPRDPLVSLPVFVGDEVNAAGFRLAGVQVHTPAAGGLAEAIAWARDNAPLVLISAEIANRLPAPELDRLLARTTPPVVVVPDVHNKIPMSDLAIRLRRQLGVLE